MAQIESREYGGTMHVATLTPDVQELLECVKAFTKGPTPISFEIDRDGGFLGSLNIRIWNTSRQSLSGNVFTWRAEWCARVTPEGHLEDRGCHGQDGVGEDPSRFEFEQVLAQLDEELEKEDVVEMVNQLVSMVLEWIGQKESENNDHN